MKAFRVCSILLSVLALAIVGAPTTVNAGPGELSAAANAELALARQATEIYRDVHQAEADGYVNEGYISGEGFEYVNEALIDCTFDIERPEALHYIPSGNGLRLVGVEYVIPIVCTPDDPPDGFSGDADEWEFMAEGFPIWNVQAWVWYGNPNGVFADHPHPRIP